MYTHVCIPQLLPGSEVGVEEKVDGKLEAGDSELALQGMGLV